MQRFYKMKILIIDNYDSFTYNLVQMVEEIVGKNVSVIKNDEISFDKINEFDKIILSPGPGIPSEAGKLLETIKKFAGKKPILGVCLGMQAIAEAFGGNLKLLDSVYHGVAIEAEIIKSDALLFKNLPSKFSVGRYHSWVVNKDKFPEDLEITSLDDLGNIMSLQHKSLNIHGVQYHPESILTPFGKVILENFLLNN